MADDVPDLTAELDAAEAGGGGIVSARFAEQPVPAFLLLPDWKDADGKVTIALELRVPVTDDPAASPFDWTVRQTLGTLLGAAEITDLFAVAPDRQIRVVARPPAVPDPDAILSRIADAYMENGRLPEMDAVPGGLSHLLVEPDSRQHPQNFRFVAVWRDGPRASCTRRLARSDGEP
jgi:hypothetical protein